MDLVSTIGESVALGAAGIILWGDSRFASSKASVNTLKSQHIVEVNDCVRK